MKKLTLTKLNYICCLFLTVLLCVGMLLGCSKADINESIEENSKKSEAESKTTPTIQDPTRENVDLSGKFNGINGCAVIFNPQKSQYSFYNESMSEQGVSPFSTFKIISTLIGLQNGIVEDETSTMNYNGTQYLVPEWNRNLSLQDAFQSSCVWYFRQVIDTVGEDEVKKELDKLQYGNCDVSEWKGSNINSIQELNGFWLKSSLKISPLEQVQILSKIFEGKSMYSDKSIGVLKNIMLIEDNGIQQIYGKTGSGPNNGEAWFVGFSEKDKQRDYFAIYLYDRTQKEVVSGKTAKEIALKIMK